MGNKIIKAVFIAAIFAGTAAAADYKLVTPDPLPQAQALADYLQSEYGKGIISGQMDETWISRIYEASGKYPALVGYDLDGIQNGGIHESVGKATRFVKDKGGIAQINWHWVRPDGGGDYYSKGFDLQGALSDTNGTAGKLLMDHIHKAARQFEVLQDSGVAVLWRPLHEAEGGWFWWGMSGKDACQKLYRLMFDVFTKQHHLKNLIWVWTSYAGDKENWYPGDDVVDMIVYDYPDDWAFGKFQNLFGNSGKMFGIGENGGLPDPDKFSAQPYSYFMTWDYMILENWETDKYGRKGANSRDWINKVYNAPTTITLDRLPKDLYTDVNDSVTRLPGATASAEPADGIIIGNNAISMTSAEPVTVRIHSLNGTLITKRTGRELNFIKASLPRGILLISVRQGKATRTYRISND